MPDAKRLGTLWTPAEINSEYYLELAKRGARDLGFDIVDVPIANKNEVLHSAQLLINKKIDAIYDRLLTIYDVASKNGSSTSAAAIALADYRLQYGIGKREREIYFHHSLDQAFASK